VELRRVPAELDALVVEERLVDTGDGLLLEEVEPDDGLPEAEMLLVEERLVDVGSWLPLEEVEPGSELAEVERLLWDVLVTSIEEEDPLFAAPDAAARTLDPAVPRELLEELPDDKLVEDVEDCALVDCPLVDCEVKLAD